MPRRARPPPTRWREPRTASAASSNTGSSIARESARASLAWACDSSRSHASSVVRASARRRRTRSGDACAGSSPNATCSRRRASSWPPSHHSWLASATVSAKPLAGPGGLQRIEQRGAGGRGIARGGLRVGERALQRAAAGLLAGLVGQQSQRGGVAARRAPRRGGLQFSGGGAEQRDRVFIAGAGGLLDVMGAPHRSRAVAFQRLGGAGVRAEPPRGRGCHVDGVAHDRVAKHEPARAPWPVGRARGEAARRGRAAPPARAARPRRRPVRARTGRRRRRRRRVPVAHRAPAQPTRRPARPRPRAAPSRPRRRERARGVARTRASCSR